MIFLRKFFNFFIASNIKFINFIAILRYFMGFPIYLLSVYFFKISYFGGYLFSDQDAGRGRTKTIADIASRIDKKLIKVLELGVYCGQTTINISKSLKNNLSEIVCVDIWDAFYNTSDTSSFVHKKMVDNLKDSKVYNLFMHNLKANNLLNKCKVIKKKSSNFFYTNTDKFDLIIIDASHLYKEVLLDIINSKKILNESGLLIGDDYEVPFSSVSHLNFNKNLKKLDVFYDFKTKTRFHPGVTLAVFQEFGNIKSRNGLFCLKKSKGKFYDFFN